MYAFKTLVAILALSLVSVEAVPVRHRRRDSCRAHSSSAVLATTSTASVTTDVSSVTTSIADSTTSASASIITSKSSSKAATSSTRKASSTSSSASSSATGSSSNSSGLSGLLKKLFPVSDSVSWTTSTAASDALSLSDATFGVTKLIKALTHTYMNAPDGKMSMQAHYPKGSYTFGHSPQGGFSFYATGPSDFSLADAKEATLSYTVMFDEGFDFNKGGKLPGLYGGDSATEAASCSGGRRDDGCWSARFMWRTGGMGELYTYLPPSYSANKAVCNVAPQSECNSVYGASVGRGSFNFAAGTRALIGQRVKLNDVGQENGELELFVNGESVFTVQGLVFRDKEEGRFQGIQMQTFFGGTLDASWGSPKDQNTYFSDFSVAVTEKF
ncbi:uncharacterized protein BXZ73DRAFT_92799 [Epithele typhae]|uniref:uncharacterized protein n=1 Tax=Epithele typhae TaxID=378194 RepID=UPI0020073A01|nr:uncharacterized protein BXZ73DRAFT_92799 [Epithele typhae]KAH9914516.1 hypothetical protein BXZ73DRAFT_92799 [Epithele typhae]